MKKSKVIIPALSLIAFSMAASITGAVAWFTANRVATVTAGEFAVVNTTSALDVSLATGVGTSINNSGEVKVVTVTEGYKLTDGSLDHTDLDHSIIAPDITGNYVGSATPLASVGSGGLVRDDATHVYTAFTWNMTFTVAYGGSASLAAGLFLDCSDATTYMHEKVHFAKDATIPANTYYATAACSGDKMGETVVSAENGMDVYKQAPDETGKAFRIAFIPTAISTTGSGTVDSVAYSKVWAANQTKSDAGFIDKSDSDYAADVDLSLVEAAYSTETTKLTGHDNSATAAAATAGTDKVLIDSSCSEGIPGNKVVSDATALSGKANYLGYFGLNPGKSVSITYTCVAWFDGTDEDEVAEGGANITSNATDFETIVTSMKFGVSNLLAA